MITDRDRETDAAFFEDWSAWASLDDLPAAPTSNGQRIINGHRAWGKWSAYYCLLSLDRGWTGGPHFEICVPNRNPMMSICRRLPQARQHPSLNSRPGYRKLAGTWQIPAAHWRNVRAALPALKADILRYVDCRPL